MEHGGPLIGYENHLVKQRSNFFYLGLCFRQRYAPKLYKEFHFEDMPLSVFRAALKKQFTNNAHLTDFRIIDRKIAECRQVKHLFFFLKKSLVFSDKLSSLQLIHAKLVQRFFVLLTVSTVVTQLDRCRIFPNLYVLDSNRTRWNTFKLCRT